MDLTNMISVKKEKEDINDINCKNNNFGNDVIFKNGGLPN